MPPAHRQRQRKAASKAKEGKARQGGQVGTPSRPLPSRPATLRKRNGGATLCAEERRYLVIGLHDVALSPSRLLYEEGRGRARGRGRGLPRWHQCLVPQGARAHVARARRKLRCDGGSILPERGGPHLSLSSEPPFRHSHRRLSPARLNRLRLEDRAPRPSLARARVASRRRTKGPPAPRVCRPGKGGCALLHCCTLRANLALRDCIAATYEDLQYHNHNLNSLGKGGG